jgi:hypothetical protein
MTITTVNEVKRMHGTNADRLAFAGYASVAVIFYETDTNSEYEWNGAEWILKSINGAVCVTQSTLTAGERVTADVIAVEQQFEYETVAASQTTQALGAVGAIGDFLHSIIITASTGTITIFDGATAVVVIPAGALGVWPINLVSVVGAWNITTAAATSCTAVGRFS